MTDSVIDIKVKDAEFEAFLEKFNGYMAGLGAMSAEWRKVNAGIKSVASAQGKSSSEQVATNKRIAGSVTLIGKAWDGVNRVTASVGKTVSATAGILGRIIPSLRTLGIGSAGLLGVPAASLAFFTALSRGFSSDLGKNRGLGVTQGEREGFKIAYSNRFGFDESTLARIQEQKFTNNFADAGLARGKPFQSFDELSNLNPVTQLNDVIANVRELSKRDEFAAKRAAKAGGLTPEQYNRVISATAQEMAELTSSFEKARKAAELNADSLNSFTRFTAAVDTAVISFKTSLARVLEPLAGPLSKVSDALIAFIESLAAAGTLRKGVDSLASSIVSFGNYLNSAEARADWEAFRENLRTVSGLLGGVAKFFRFLGKSPTQDFNDTSPRKVIPSDPVGGIPLDSKRISQGKIDLGTAARTSSIVPSSGEVAANRALAKSLSRNIGSLDERIAAAKVVFPRLSDEIITTAVKADAANNLPPGTVASLIYRESRGNRDAVSSKGARGLTQLLPDTAKELGVSDLRDVSQTINAGAQYLGRQLKASNGNLDEALARYNAGGGAVNRLNAAGKDYTAFPETRNYVPGVLAGAARVQAQITVTSRTGDNTATTVSAGSGIAQVSH